MAERNHKPRARVGKSETPKPHREFPYIRRLKVHPGQYYHQTLSNSCRVSLVPWVHIKGYWLEEAGFTVGTPVHVEVSEGRLVISAAPEPADA